MLISYSHKSGEILQHFTNLKNKEYYELIVLTEFFKDKNDLLKDIHQKTTLLHHVYKYFL